MLASSRGSPARSRLASYLVIFASAYAALTILMLILGELGLAEWDVTRLMLAVPAGIVVAVGALAYARDAGEFLVADRAVPASVIGLSGAVSLLGGTGLVALAGAFFFLGFDALPFVLGTVLGLLVAGVMIVPYARKDGSTTLAGYVGRRFESRLLRLVTGTVLTLPTLLILIAELKIGGFIGAHALGLPAGLVVWSLALLAVLGVLLGGLKSLSWTGTAQGIIALVGLLVPVVIAAVLVTNLPLPQITYGMASDELARLEAQAGLSARPAASMALTMPGAAPAALVKPFLLPFAATGPVSFMLLVLTVAMGVASLPSLLMRAGAAGNVREARRASVWTLCIVAGVGLTLPAFGFFARHVVLSGLIGQSSEHVPQWLDVLVGLDLAEYDTVSGVLALHGVRFARDGLPLVLPLALGLPRVMVDFVLVGMLAAVLAGASAQILALAGIWTEDVLFAWSETGSAARARLSAARGLTAGGAMLGAWLALNVRADPLTLFTWALSIAASAVFSILIMSVWWKRVSQWGAVAGLAAGTATALLQIALALNGNMPLMFGLSGALAAAIGVPLSAAVALGVSLLTPRPEHRVVELVRDIRVPGGETVYDREARLARVGKPRNS